MARKPKAPNQDSTPAVPGADNLPENQQPEQTETPPIEANIQPPEVTAEPLSFEAFKAAKEAEAVAAETPAPEEEQEDTRQEWEKPLAEIEAEQQPKHKGRPPKAAEDKETSGQVGAVDKVPPSPILW